MAEYKYPLFFEAKYLTDKDKKTIRKHFQKRKSGGGKCRNIEMTGGNIYKVCFKKKKDQEKVLQKKDHHVTLSSGKQCLSVTANCPTQTPHQLPQARVLMQDSFFAPEEIRVNKTISKLERSVPLWKDITVVEKKFRLVEEEFNQERNACCPEVKICISNNMIILEGPDQEVFSGAKKLNELMKKVMKKTIKLPMELIAFIKSSGAISKYQTWFQSLRNPVSIDVGSDLVLFSLSSEALEEAEAAILRDLRDLRMDTVQLQGSAAAPPDVGRVKEILTKARNEENHQGLKVENSFIPGTSGTSETNIQHVGNNESVNKLKEIPHDSQMNHVETQKVMNLSPDLLDCFDKVLSLSGTNWDKSEVTLKTLNAPHPHVLLSGPCCRVQEVQKNLRTSLASLKSDTLVLEGSGAQRYFQAEGRTNMELVESAFKVIIREGKCVQGTKQQGFSSPISLTSSQAPKINLEIKLGSLEYDKVNVMVVPMLNRKLTSTAIGKCLSKKVNKFRTKFFLAATKCTLQPGDVMQVDAPPSLGCSKILFIECLPWDGVRGQSKQALASGLKRCLDLCVQQGSSSVAFPIIGPGLVLKYPLREAAKVLTETIRQFALSTYSGSLSTIHVVIKPGYANTVECYHDVYRWLNLNMTQGDQVIFRSITTDLDEIAMTVGEGVKLTLVIGDITNETTDGIVNSTDFIRFNTGGVCKDILAVAGPDVEAELKKAKVNQGEVFVTHPGSFPCKAILHVYGQRDAGVIEQLACKIIQYCETFEFKSVAIPAICAGAGKMDPGVVAGAILQGIKTAILSTPLSCLTDIRLVLININLVFAFAKKAMQVFPTVVIDRVSASQMPHVQQQDQSSTNTDLSILCTSSTNQQSVFHFLGLNTQTMDTAMTKLKELYQAQCSTQTFTQEQLEVLTQNEIKDLKHLLESQGLHIKRDQSGQGILTVCGLKDGVSQVMQMVNGFQKNSLIREIRLRDEDELYPRVAWCILGCNGNWERLPKTANYDLENNGASGGIVDAQGNSWSVNLQGMKATRRQTGQKTKLKRLENRPDFILPVYWDNMTVSETTKVVVLHPSSVEYRAVKEAFRRTVTKTVTKIERVQNIHLHCAYETLKKQISDNNILLGGPGEKLLYHGTSQDNCNSIMKTGFNRNFAGQNATLYGHGTYFAVDASYSANIKYSKPAADGSQSMFVARVLTGTYTVGHSNMKVPPHCNNQQPDDRYDSLVDNINNPSMYVVFHDSQAYPDYLITFK
ncbi:protein mono-ADP-ribosyltransferase PARP14-like isoform X2 [Betta splendens]|uniref:Poly [ADP-ribose] polymerase n=1 Tax=Betta splendens TaxID=158456 RepID=A0A8M1HN22_BETSP|nr:protein mono-ADP-ribosyltransferase PARP14-like isoform X2 [Betta splendens]